MALAHRPSSAACFAKARVRGGSIIGARCHPQLPRPPDVRLRRNGRRRRIARCDRIDDRAMFDRDLTAASGQRIGREAEKAYRVIDRARRTHEKAIMCCDVDREMQTFVQSAQIARGVVGVPREWSCRNASISRSVAFWAAVAAAMPSSDLPREIELGDFARSERRDDEAAAVHRRGETMSLQQSERFPDRRPADIQPCGDVAFDEAIPRLDRALADRLADFLVDAVDQRKRLQLRGASRLWAMRSAAMRRRGFSRAFRDCFAAILILPATCRDCSMTIFASLASLRHFSFSRTIYAAKSSGGTLMGSAPRSASSF